LDAESAFVKLAVRSMALSNCGMTLSVNVLPNCDHAASSRFTMAGRPWFITSNVRPV
jgi:hypothetical protein